MLGKDAKRFECQYPGCDLSYQRKEHLHRHEAQHRGPAHPCPFCRRTFARNDTLRRHVGRDHANSQLASTRTAQACESCRVAKIRCRGGHPCSQCEAKGRQCIFTNPSPAQQDAGKHIEDADKIALEPLLPDANPGDKVQHCVYLYFAHFHRHWPILHPGTFDIVHEPPFLVQAVMMVGLWASGSASAKRAAIELHSRLGPSIQEQRTNWYKTFEEEETEGDDTPASRWPIATYQGILLYLIFSLISSEARCNSLDLTLSMVPSDRGILSALCETCLRNNIFYYPRMLERYRDLDSITCIWVGVEEIKRLGLALYKVSRLCGDRLIGLPNLQFPIPDSRHLWNAQSNPELSRLLQIEADRGKRLDGSQEGNWISTFGEWLDSSMEAQWI